MVAALSQTAAVRVPSPSIGGFTRSNVHLHPGVFLIGVFAGLRPMTPLAGTSWAPRELLNLQIRLAFLGFAYRLHSDVLAIGELIVDKMPATPSRKLPMPFVARIAVGAICGGAIGFAGGSLLGSLVAGMIGAVVGTLGGAELRTRLTRANGGKDLPVALLEDAIAIGGAIVVLSIAMKPPHCAPSGRPAPLFLLLLLLLFSFSDLLPL